MAIANRIASIPVVYDLVQHVLGDEQSVRRLKPYFSQMAGATIADIGAGTGYWAHLIPSTARYTLTDVDLAKLLAFRRKRLPGCTVLSDAARMSFGDKSVDFTLALAVTHHLPDEQLCGLLSEAARISRRGFLFLDPLVAPDLWRSRLLWRYDLGHYPRAVDELRAAISERFVIEREEIYEVHHRYLLCFAIPRTVTGR